MKDPKNRRDHTLPLGRYLLALLKRRRENAPTGAVYVFEDRLGRVVSNFRYVQNKVAEAGVSFTVHDLRRTFATVAESLELSSYAVKKLLNHATASDVTAGYIVMDLERLRSAMQRIEDAILRHGGVIGAGEVVELTKRRSVVGRR